MIIIEVTNPVYSRIYSGDGKAETLKTLLWYAEQMKIYVENYRFHPSFKAKRWDGKLSFFNAGSGYILTGLINHSLNILKQYDECVVKDPHHLLFSSDEPLTVDPNIFVDSPCGFSLFDDQEFVINKLLNKKRGVAEVATGAGKTLLTCALLETIQPEHGLVIVPNLNLVMQTYDEGFVACGLEEKTGMYYGKQKDELRQYTVATWQSLILNKDLMSCFDAIILDECHGVKGREIQDLMIHAENAIWRYGVTGTIPRDKCTRTTLEGVFGPTLVQVSSLDLQNRGRLSNCCIIMVNIEYPGDFKKRINDEANLLMAEAKLKKKEAPALKRKHKLKELAKYQPRIAAIQKLIAASSGMSVILNNYKEEGINLNDGLTKSVFMDGSTSIEERKKYKEQLTSGEMETLVTSYKMGSTGLNYPHLKNVFMTSPTKAYVTVIQSIGRALRKANDKSLAFIFDINDKIPNVESGQTRKSYYEEKQFPVKEITINLSKQEKLF